MSPQLITIAPLETTTFTLKSVKDNACGEGYVAGSAKITIIEPLAVEEETSSIFNVFPNPTESNITISLKVPSNKTTNVEMTDLQGRIITTPLINNANIINVSQLPAGLYFMQLSFKEDTQIIKFIKE